MTIEWLQPLPADAADPGTWRYFLSLHGKERDQLPPWLFWTYLGISIGLVTMAGMASGLTLGLMSLDELDLEVSCVVWLPGTAAAPSEHDSTVSVQVLSVVWGWAAAVAGHVRLAFLCRCIVHADCSNSS